MKGTYNLLDQINSLASKLHANLCLLGHSGDEWTGPNGQFGTILRKTASIDEELDILWDRRRRFFAAIDKVRFSQEVDHAPEWNEERRLCTHVEPVC